MPKYLFNKLTGCRPATLSKNTQVLTALQNFKIRTATLQNTSEPLLLHLTLDYLKNLTEY